MDIKKLAAKSFAVFRIGIVNAFYLRGEMIVWVLLSLLPLIAMLIIWPQVYMSAGNSLQYSLGQMLTYYLAGHFLSAFIITHFDTWMVTRVRRGDISRDFLQPLSPSLRVIMLEAGWRVLRTVLFSLPLALILGYAYRSYLTLPSLNHVIILIPLAIIGFGISGLMNLLVVGAAFKLEHANSLVHLRWALETILGGSLLPFELLPSRLSNLANALPFRYLYYVPSQMFMNRYTPAESVSHLLTAATWLIILSLLVKWLWQILLKSYTAVGN